MLWLNEVLDNETWIKGKSDRKEERRGLNCEKMSKRRSILKHTWNFSLDCRCLWDMDWTLYQPSLCTYLFQSKNFSLFSLSLHFFTIHLLKKRGREKKEYMTLSVQYVLYPLSVDWMSRDKEMKKRPFPSFFRFTHWFLLLQSYLNFLRWSIFCYRIKCQNCVDIQAWMKQTKKCAKQVKEGARGGWEERRRVSSLNLSFVSSVSLSPS